MLDLLLAYLMLSMGDNGLKQPGYLIQRVQCEHGFQRGWKKPFRVTVLGGIFPSRCRQKNTGHRQPGAGTDADQAVSGGMFSSRGVYGSRAMLN
jgi:hypothetical protein